MIELELLGVGGDGESLVFTDVEGERYRIQITDELRGAIRRDRPRIESAPDPAKQALRPRDIQAMLRAGVTPEEIAARHGIDITNVTRYEAPIAAEKAYALQRALATTIGAAADGPTMGDLVVDRLAARGVDPSSLSWTAQREAHNPWQICLTFVQGAAERGAHWLLTPSGVLEAVDQEAQWLTETVASAPAASIFTPLPIQDRVGADDSDADARETLIDQLNAARGKRQDIEYDLDEGEEIPDDFPAPLKPDKSHDSAAESISARIYSLANARTKDDEPEPTADDAAEPDDPAPTDRTAAWIKPSSSRPAPASPVAEADTESSDPDALPGMESLAPTQSSKKSKSRRRSVPSWDEIVFGAKPQ